MKKIFIFFLLSLPIVVSAQLNLPFGINVLNPKPLDAKYYNTSGTAYTNTAQVISQLTSGLRYEGLTVNVAGTEYWFYGGVADGNLVAKVGSFTLTDGNGTTANGTAVDLGGTATSTVAIDLDGNTFSLTNGNQIDLSSEIVTISSSVSTIDITGETNVNITSGLGGAIDVSSDVDITGQLSLPASTTSLAPINIPHGVAPTSPADGNIWTTTDNLFGRINGTTTSWLKTTGTSTRTGNVTIDGANSTVITSSDTYSAEIKIGNSSPGDGSSYFKTSAGGYGLELGNTPVGYSTGLTTNSQAGTLRIGKYSSFNSGNPFVIFDLTASSDASGDTYFRNALGLFDRLPKGTDGQVMTLASGLPSWADPSGGGGGLTVGTSTITSGTNTKVLYNNSGVLGEYTVSGSGNVALTTSPTFTTPALGTPSGIVLTNGTGLVATTGLTATGTKNSTTFLRGDNTWAVPSGSGGSYWDLATGGTLTGANTITTTSTNSVTLAHSGSLGTTQTPALIFSNPNAATAGNQQASNAIKLSGYGWKTAITAASQPVDIYTYALPVQGSTNPSVQFRIDGRINGGTIANAGYFQFDGTTGNSGLTVGLLNITNSNTATSTTFQGNRYLDFNTISGPSGATWQSNMSATLTGLTTAGGIMKWSGSFTRSSGTNAIQFLKVQPTINTTSTYAGQGIGLDIDPILTSVTGYTNVAIRATSGQTLLNGTTPTASTTLEALGISSGNIARLANSSNTRRFNFSDAGVMTIDAAPATAASTSDVLLTRDVSSGDVEKLGIGSGLTISGGNLVAAQGSIATTGSYYATTTQSPVTMAASGTGDYAIGIPSYGNKTILVVETQFMAMKSDGTAAAFSTVTSMFRKDNSGTWTADSAGTSTTSDATTIVSISGVINGSVPSIHYVSGAYSGTYAGGFTCKLSSYQY